MYQLNRLILALCLAGFSSESPLVRASCGSGDEPRVSLTSGCVEGVVKTSVLGRTYYSFQGIPYAAPPVGNLRFRAPQPVTPWSGVLKANEEPPACLQPWRENPFPIYFSEDCLYLNVFTPYLKHPEGKPMPVIVWIHGGKFYQGSDSTYKYGPDFFLMKDVILVNINYRLGIFGFLNLNISEAQGNASMKDKIAALRWVQREIGKFGGDPSRVTIVGGSSGASDVAFLYVSPLAKGLFHRAISQSGAALCYFSFMPSTASFALRVASSLGCPADDPRKAVTCLRDTHGSVLAEQQMLVGGIEGVDLPFLPSIERNLGEEVFLPDTPQNLISKSGNVPYIIGLNDGEGLMYLANLKGYELKNMKERITSYLPVHMVKNTSQEVLQKMHSKIKDIYFRQNSSFNDSIYGFVNFMTDSRFAYCILKTAEALSVRAPVYLYYFTFQGNFQPPHTYNDLNLSGVCHGDELGYLFYRSRIITAQNNLTSYPRDMAMVKKAITLWTNFAAHGNPTPFHQDEINVTWSPANPKDNKHLIINEELKMIHSSLLKDREKLWENLYQILWQAKSKREQRFFIYTVICFLGILGIILAINYKQERNLYFKL